MSYLRCFVWPESNECRNMINKATQTNLSGWTNYTILIGFTIFPFFFFSLTTSKKIEAEAVTWWCSIKEMLKILQNSLERICARFSFLIKTYASAYNFIKKETLAQVFSCEFCKISKRYYRTSPGDCFYRKKTII